MSSRLPTPGVDFGRKDGPACPEQSRRRLRHRAARWLSHRRERRGNPRFPPGLTRRRRDRTPNFNLRFRGGSAKTDSLQGLGGHPRARTRSRSTSRRPALTRRDEKRSSTIEGPSTMVNRSPSPNHSKSNGAPGGGPVRPTERKGSSAPAASRQTIFPSTTVFPVDSLDGFDPNGHRQCRGNPPPTRFREPATGRQMPAREWPRRRVVEHRTRAHSAGLANQPRSRIFSDRGALAGTDQRSGKTANECPPPR